MRGQVCRGHDHCWKLYEKLNNHYAQSGLESFNLIVHSGQSMSKS